MRIRSVIAGLSTLALAGGVVATAATPATAAGNRSLATVLTSDGDRFDRKARDFDVLTQAVLAVLEAKPSSPVSLLTTGRQRATVFAPTDQAFRVLAYDLTGDWLSSERKVFRTVAGLGVDTVETVLLYHVVGGATLTSPKALAADGSDVTTAQGGTVEVDVINPNAGLIRLGDQDPDDIDALTVTRLLDINGGNKQVAHGVSYVLRPADL